MLLRLFFTLTLTLLFALGQQGAVVHAVTHVTDTQGQPQDEKHHAPCQQCATYAQSTHAVPVAAFLLPSVVAAHVPPDAVVPAASPLRIHACQARAPPGFS